MEKAQKLGELYWKLKEYQESDYYPYHMPGHKRRAAGELPEDFFGIDITEIEGFDNLHQPEGILRELQEQAAELYGAEESFYLVNGSTAGILSAVSASLPEGGHILIARNCHRSVYHAVYLRNLTVSFLEPMLIAGYDVCEAISPVQVEEALEREPGIGAVLVVSPTYEGRIADIGSIAHIVHKRGIPLIVDEAHGAHLGFHSDYAENSCRLGADLVIHSVHKTLPAMTQTAVLHRSGRLVSSRLLKRFLQIYQSSSPSYVLISSIENAMCIVRNEGGRRLEELSARWKKMLSELAACRHLDVLEDGTGRQDIGKLVISARKTGLSGQQLYDMLLWKHHLQLEMAAGNFALAMFTMGDSVEGFDRMTKALLEIDRELSGMPVTDPNEHKPDGKESSIDELLLSTAECSGKRMTLRQAWDSPARECDLEASAGLIAGDFIMLYPPGIPIVVPGDILTTQIIAGIKESLMKGLNIQGVCKRRESVKIIVLEHE